MTLTSSARLEELAGEQVFYEVAELVQPAANRFTVVAIYPDQPRENGCLAIVQSLHDVRAEAEAAAALLRAAQGTPHA